MAKKHIPDIKHKVKEIEQEKSFLEGIANNLDKKVKTVEQTNKNLKIKLDETKQSYKNTIQEKILLENSLEEQDAKVNTLEKSNKDLETKLDKVNHECNNIIQEKMFLEENKNELDDQVKALETKNKNLDKKLITETQSSAELQQEKMAFDDIMDSESSKSLALNKKLYLSIALAGIVFAAVFSGYTVFVVSLIGEEYRVADVSSISSGYTIQNLRGDTIDTYLSWRLVPGDTIYVNILNADKYPPEKIDVIKKTILSEEMIEIDNSLLHKGPKGTTSAMFIGWQGAMTEAAKNETVLHIPVSFEVLESNNGEGDITIELTDRRNADGFSGWTNSIADESQNQILKSRITIFAINSISNAYLETITRHELGHALGLAHSSATEDLMYPTIKTNFPYISECDIDAIQLLYDGGKRSEVVCET